MRTCCSRMRNDRANALAMQPDVGFFGSAVPTQCENSRKLDTPQQTRAVAMPLALAVMVARKGVVVARTRAGAVVVPAMVATSRPRSYRSAVLESKGRSVPPARPKPAGSATAPAQQSLAAASSEPSR
eukprot:1787890-Prymnesium_polylepis.1